MITGANGYVAGWIVKRLLDEGLIVHAAVRNPDDEEKFKYLNKVAETAPGTIKYFESDLLEYGSYAEAMTGCQVLFHTASPCIMYTTDPQKDLIEPAQLGTRNVLEEANKTSTVKRVVLTSSVVAMYGDNVDLESYPNGICTEEFWNNSSSLTHQPYFYSKALAEKEAWKLHNNQSQWDLVTINSPLVIGPGINPYGTSESFNVIKQYGDGSMKLGMPRMGVGIVDVRDLAEAHFNAGFYPEAKGRYITSAYNTDLFSMSQMLLEKYGADYPIPRKALPKWLVWTVAPLVNKAFSRKVIARNINKPWKGDNSKSINELNMKYRPLKESMEDFFQQMIDSGQLKKTT